MVDVLEAVLLGLRAFHVGGGVQGTGGVSIGDRVRAHVHGDGDDGEDPAQLRRGCHVPDGDADGEDGTAGRRYASTYDIYISYTNVACIVAVFFFFFE